MPDGIETFIEIGPGRTLSNMIRKIDSTVRIYAVAELDQILREVQMMLKGKAAIVTGGSRGIGAAIVRKAGLPGRRMSP